MLKGILITAGIAGIAFLLIKQSQKKKKKPTEEENYAGVFDGVSNIASSMVLLAAVIVGVVIVVGLSLFKKASDNPDKAFEYAEKGANVYSKIKRA